MMSSESGNYGASLKEGLGWAQVISATTKDLKDKNKDKRDLLDKNGNPVATLKVKLFDSNKNESVVFQRVYASFTSGLNNIQDAFGINFYDSESKKFDIYSIAGLGRPCSIKKRQSDQGRLFTEIEFFYPKEMPLVFNHKAEPVSAPAPAAKQKRMVEVEVDEEEDEEIPF